MSGGFPRQEIPWQTSRCPVAVIVTLVGFGGPDWQYATVPRPCAADASSQLALFLPGRRKNRFTPAPATAGAIVATIKTAVRYAPSSLTIPATVAPVSPAGRRAHFRLSTRVLTWVRVTEKARAGAKTSERSVGMPIEGNGNASVFEGHSPPAHVPSQRASMVGWANWGVANCAHFFYDETAERSMMFNLKPGDLSKTIHADCSQFYSSCAHWSGVQGLTDTDYTGTLLEKGKALTAAEAKPGDCVIWGPGTGEHAAMFVAGGYAIGFGHQGAPDRVAISDITTWMEENGHGSEVRYLAFADD